MTTDRFVALCSALVQLHGPDRPDADQTVERAQLGQLDEPLRLFRRQRRSQAEETCARADRTRSSSADPRVIRQDQRCQAQGGRSGSVCIQRRVVYSSCRQLTALQISRRPKAPQHNWPPRLWLVCVSARRRGLADACAVQLGPASWSLQGAEHRAAHPLGASHGGGPVCSARVGAHVPARLPSGPDPVVQQLGQQLALDLARSHASPQRHRGGQRPLTFCGALPCGAVHLPLFASALSLAVNLTLHLDCPHSARG